MISLLIFALLNLTFGATVYVNVNSPAGSSGNGSSWSLAFNNLQSALTVSNSEIWVVTDTYKPSAKYGMGYSGTDAQLVTFLLASNTHLYGGFIGTETNRSQRNPSANPTILSGDILGDDVYGSSSNKGDNAWHVLTVDGAVNVIVDGFIIQGGYAAGPDSGSVALGVGNTSFITSLGYTHALGGGLVARHGAQVTLNNVILKDNQCNSSNSVVNTINPPVSSLASGGAAIGIADTNTLVTVTGSKIMDNLALASGTRGAINVIFDGNLQLTSCVVSGNRGERSGAAIHGRDAAQLTLTSSTFTSNQLLDTFVGDGSGTVVAFDSNLTITSCNFNLNSILTGTGSGGVFFHTPFDDGETYLFRVTSSTFTSNSGLTLGGAINIFGIIPNANVNAAITSCVFTNNSAILGSAIYIDGIPTTITSCVFNNNKAGVSGTIFASDFSGAIFNRTELATRTQTTLTSSSFNGNTVTGLASPAVPVFVLNFLASVFSGGTASVTAIPIGGAGIAAEFGAKMNIVSSVFVNNNAPTGCGGAILVAGSSGSSGGTNLGMNQAYLSIVSSAAVGNSDQSGSNNVCVENPAGLPNVPNGVYFLTDGSVI